MSPPPALAPPERACLYRPRRPRDQPLFRILSDHYPAFVAEYEERHQATWGRLRPVVARTVEGYLRCGLPEHGFARLRCPGCASEVLLPFSCRTRGLCTSCGQKRAVAWARWVATELAREVPHRQVVVTLPRILRPYFKYDRSLLTDLSRWVYECVHALMAGLADEPVRPGCVSVLELSGNLLNLQPHLHQIVTDGGLGKPTGLSVQPGTHRGSPREASGRRGRSTLRRTFPDGAFDRSGERFYPLPARFWRLLEEQVRRKVLAELHARGLLPTERRDMLLSWRRSGFSVHVGRPVRAGDTEGLERLARYVRRLHLAESRIVYDETLERVIFSSGKRPHPRFKANFRIFPAREFVAAVCGFLPDTYRHETVAYGEYSNAVRGRRRRRASEDQEIAPQPVPPARARAAWRELIERIYEVDPLLCSRCGETLRIVSIITRREVIEAILRHLGLWPPPRRVPRLVLPQPPPEAERPRADPEPPAAPDESERSQVPAWWDDDEAFCQVPPGWDP